MEQMISAVLAFIRDASAASTREPLDLLSLLECTVDDAAMMGADASIDADWSPVVDGDPVALQRLFANLVDNAVKYGGSAAISLHQEGGDVRVDIADKGPGLPEGELERVFEAFYRADRARNLDDGGIGLGLAVARSIAREHGGDVHLTCTGEGLTAHVGLPLRRVDPRAF
jgi:signal transduction histidine kinase